MQSRKDCLRLRLWWHKLQRGILIGGRKMKKAIVLSIAVVVFSASFVSAELVRGINMDFVTIGNAGNAADTQVMTNDGGTTGYGAVGYNYRIGKYEVTNAQWNTFTAAAGVPTGNPSNAYDASAYYTGAQQPTNNVSWYEAAQFCNYLTSGNKSLGAYQISYYGKITVDRAAAISAYGTVYVIPTEDEWYKAAYFKPDGSGYSRYANGLNTMPAADNGWNYYGGSYNIPWNVGSGIQEQNGTFDMMGNIREFNEIPFEEYSDNLTPFEEYTRVMRGGSFYSGQIFDPDYLASSRRQNWLPYTEGETTGFRIVAIPEPCSLVLLSLGGLVLRGRKK
jgi:hypothetical protein